VIVSGENIALKPQSAPPQKINTTDAKRIRLKTITLEEADYGCSSLLCRHCGGVYRSFHSLHDVKIRAVVSPPYFIHAAA
jgi:hypothetical protein